MGRPFVQHGDNHHHHPYQKPSSEASESIFERGYSRINGSLSSRDGTSLAPGSFQRRRLTDETPSGSFVNLGPAFQISSRAGNQSTGPVRRNSSSNAAGRLCEAWEHPRRKLLELEIESELAATEPSASNSTHRGSLDLTTDDLEEMIIRQLRPRALNMLFGSSLRNTGLVGFGNSNPEASTLEGIMERLRRQVRIQQQLLDEPPSRRYITSSNDDRQNNTSEAPSLTVSPSTLHPSSNIPSTLASNSRFRSAVFPRPYENVAHSPTVSSRHTNPSRQDDSTAQIVSDTFYRWSMVRRSSSQQRSSPSSGNEAPGFRSSIPVPTRTIATRQNQASNSTHDGYVNRSGNTNENLIFVRTAWGQQSSSFPSHSFAPAWPRNTNTDDSSSE